MRSLLPLLALALAIPVAAQDDPASNTTVAPYPAIEVLDAFREGCGSVADQAAASASLSSAGWEVAGASAMPQDLTNFLTFARDAGSKMLAAQDGTMSDMEVFEKTIAGERLFVVLSEVEANGTRVSGCRLFDLGETRPIPADIAASWLGREPDRTVDREAVTVANWEPGILLVHDSFEVFFVPQQSPFKEAFKFDGVALKIDTVGVPE